MPCQLCGMAVRRKRGRSSLLKPEKVALGARIRAARKARGLSVAELAEAVGLFRNHVYLLEQGRYAPSARSTPKLAEALGVTVEWLLTGNGRKRNGGRK